MENKKFVVDIKQEGYGCDYTIACGRDTFIIWAKDIEQARERFLEMFLADGKMRAPNCKVDLNKLDWYNKKYKNR